MANTKTIGIHPPALHKVTVRSARTNRRGLYLTLDAVIETKSPDLGLEFRVPVELTARVSDISEARPYETPTGEQDEDARKFLRGYMFEDEGATHTPADVYAVYMMWRGKATRTRFAKVLREFPDMLGTESGEFTKGSKIIVSGWSPRKPSIE